MTDREALLAAVVRAPLDDTPRLVMAPSIVAAGVDPRGGCDMSLVKVGDTVQVQIDALNTVVPPEFTTFWFDAVVKAVNSSGIVTARLPWGEIRAYCEGQYRRKEG